MKLKVHPYFLNFIHPFALAHGTRIGTQLAIVKIEREGIAAYGEASLPPYRSETFESVSSWILDQKELTQNILTKNPFDFRETIPFSKENPSASAALQSAILNWHAASQNKPLIDFFTQRNSKPDLTLTITKNDLKYLKEKTAIENNFTYFKIKLTGEKDDLDFVKSIRSVTSLPFCVDINQGYIDKEDAILLIDELEKLNCVLIEQPLKNNNHEGHYWLKQRTKLPIVADESICLYDDLVQFHEAYSGVNVKLMKCGGLFQAQKMLNFANDKQLIKLLGCMSESSLGVSTASVLASQCDMADLDSPYLNNNNPFEGFSIKNKKIILASSIKLKRGIILQD